MQANTERYISKHNRNYGNFYEEILTKKKKTKVEQKNVTRTASKLQEAICAHIYYLQCMNKNMNNKPKYEN